MVRLAASDPASGSVSGERVIVSPDDLVIIQRACVGGADRRAEAQHGEREIGEPEARQRFWAMATAHVGRGTPSKRTNSESPPRLNRAPACGIPRRHLPDANR